jgi:hypothetical protein
MEVQYGNMGYGSITKEEAERREDLFWQGLKVCSRCKRELKFDMFTQDTTTKTGLSALCKDCQKEQRKRRKPKIDQWFVNNQDRVKAQQKVYSKTHAEEKKQYNNERKEYFKGKRKEYEQQNVDKVKEQRQRYRTSAKGRYKKYEREAKERNLNFDLSIEQFDEITQQPCFYCGDFGKERNGVKYNGVDRINSLDGYNISNCVPCCETCNRMKMNHDLMDFLEHVKKIVNHTFGTEE